ncbi:MAG: 2-phosphosulfolactate phosphatase [Halanaerobiaceae bacterium]
MEINILHLLAGARQARGLTVIIDVFRAFSVACYLFYRGVEKIIPVAEVEQAYKLKKEHPSFLLVGERGGKKLPGFDYNNSPSQLLRAPVEGKTVVHTTSAGTRGLINARRAEEVITGSFVNALAVVNYIKQVDPELVSLVCMGIGGREPADEDIQCAHYLQNSLLDRDNNFEQMVKTIKKGTGQRFFDPQREDSPREDFHLCLELDRFDFVIKFQKPEHNENLPVLAIL